MIEPVCPECTAIVTFLSPFRSTPKSPVCGFRCQGPPVSVNRVPTTLLVMADERAFADVLTVRLAAEPDFAVVATACTELHADVALGSVDAAVVVASGRHCAAVVLDRLDGLDPRPGAVVVVDDRFPLREVLGATRFVSSTARTEVLLQAIRDVDPTNRRSNGA